jgi:hypothetical protein
MGLISIGAGVQVAFGCHSGLGRHLGAGGIGGSGDFKSFSILRRATSVSFLKVAVQEVAGVDRSSQEFISAGGDL